MNYSHSVEKATKFAGQALEKIDTLGIPPNPEIYEVWYAYYSGVNAEITRAIDILITTKQEIDVECCQELYERFLSDKQQGNKIKEAGDQIHDTIKDVTSMVSHVKSATSNYSETLADAKDKLDGDMSKADIEQILNSVMDNTEDILSQNKKLEEELMRSSHMMATLQQDLEAVRKEALTDGLTGLSNRKFFDSAIQEIVAKAEEEGTSFSLMMMDIDHFKSFNDNFGHQVGDQVLRLVALTLVDGVKGRDTAARYGGEEFAIILPETPMKQAQVVGDNLRKAVASKDIVNRSSGEKLGKITMSGGVAEYVAGETMDDLIARADAALYTAKHNGRNQIACAPAPRKIKRD